MKDINQDEKVFDAVAEAMEKLDGNFPLVNVLEALAYFIAISGKSVGMSPADLIACFAKTVDWIYEEEEHDRT